MRELSFLQGPALLLRSHERSTQAFPRSCARLLRDFEACGRTWPPRPARAHHLLLPRLPGVQWSLGPTEAGGLAIYVQGRSNTSQGDAGTKASATGHDAVVAVVAVDQEAGDHGLRAVEPQIQHLAACRPMTGKDFIVYRPKARPGVPEGRPRASFLGEAKSRRNQT